MTTNIIRKDMRGSMAPFEAALFTMESVRVFSMEYHDDELTFNLKLTAYGTGESEMKMNWWGRLSGSLIDSVGHLISDDERAAEQLHKESEPLRVPKILHFYAHSKEPVRWTIILAHLRMIAEQYLLEAQGAYELAIDSLETHMVLEDAEDTEQDKFDAALKKEYNEDDQSVPGEPSGTVDIGDEVPSR